MASFDVAYQLVARAEGGYQNLRSDGANKNSRGEWVGTNWGIIPATYERATGQVPSEADMRALTKAEARAMFRRLFWEPIQGDRIFDQQVANIFFDGHVNHGTWGIQLMQRALGVVADGVFGPNSLAAMLRKDPGWLFNAYKEIRRS
ncbi:MAG: glycosyl hydrolase 108 family protein, partial [Bacteroidota bacterium]